MVINAIKSAARKSKKRKEFLSYFVFFVLFAAAAAIYASQVYDSREMAEYPLRQETVNAGSSGELSGSEGTDDSGGSKGSEGKIDSGSSDGEGQQAGDSASANASADAPIDINTASAEELTGLKGIGPAKAECIVSYRNENGRFESIEDIMNVPGIKTATFEKIRDHITVNK